MKTHKLATIFLATFLAIFVVGIAVFIFSMRQISYSTVGNELAQTVEIERIKLESKINGEIAIALRMANSPIIQRYFQNPADSELQKIAFQEIAQYRKAFTGSDVFWISDIDKKYYFGDKYSYTLDTAEQSSEWYNAMMKNPPYSYSLMVNFDVGIKSIKLWIDAPVFDDNHRPLGFVGAGIDLSGFVESIYKNYSNRAALYLFNDQGEITGSSNINLITNRITLDKTLADAGAQILARAKSNETQFFKVPKGIAALTYVPSLNWHITAVLHITRTDIMNSDMIVLFLMMMAFIAIILIVSYIFVARDVKLWK